MKFSVRALRSEASSTSSRMRCTVDSPYGFSTRTVSTPPLLMQPLITLAPTPITRGMDSPVSAAVSSCEEPSSTTPSSGTRSPGLMTIVSPTSTSYGSTSSSLPSRWRLAYSGAMSIMSAIDLRDLPTA